MIGRMSIASGVMVCQSCHIVMVLHVTFNLLNFLNADIHTPLLELSIIILVI